MKIPALKSSVTLAITCLVVVIALYLGAEILWYSRYDFAFLHQWGVSPEGIQVKSLVLLGILGITVVGIAVQRK